MQELDILIPVGPSDFTVIEDVIKYAQKNIIHRNLYILTNKDNFPTLMNISNVILIDEKTAQYPFTLDDIKEKTKYKSRAGWYYQQLLKLYAFQGIPEILPSYLVLDADTVFLNPTTFLEDGKACFATGDEYHSPYFQHMSALHPSLKKYYPKSGVTHHMVFQTHYVNELMYMVEEHHRLPFWKAFLACVSEDDPISGASEYEIYFNYMFHNHGDKIVVRDLKWKNAASIDFDNEGYDYISVHNYYRKIQVCYPFNNASIEFHNRMEQELFQSRWFSSRPSNFGPHSLTPEILLDWMKDVVIDCKDYVILFILTDRCAHTFNNAFYAGLWNVDDFIALCDDNLLLVKNVEEVRTIFNAIQNIGELGLNYII